MKPENINLGILVADIIKSNWFALRYRSADMIVLFFFSFAKTREGPVDERPISFLRTHQFRSPIEPLGTLVDDIRRNQARIVSPRLVRSVSECRIPCILKAKSNIPHSLLSRFPNWETNKQKYQVKYQGQRNHEPILFTYKLC